MTLHRRARADEFTEDEKQALKELAEFYDQPNKDLQTLMDTYFPDAGFNGFTCVPAPRPGSHVHVRACALRILSGVALVESPNMELSFIQTTPCCQRPPDRTSCGICWVKV